MRNQTLPAPPVSLHLQQRQSSEHIAKQKFGGRAATQRDPTAQLACRLADASCTGAHAERVSPAPVQRAPAPGALLRLQRQYGNRFVQRVVHLARQVGSRAQPLPTASDAVAQSQAEEEEEVNKASTIQTKLTLGSPDDVYEQEANQVAEQVVGFYNSDALGELNRPLLAAVDVSTVLGLAGVQKNSITHTAGSARRRIFTNAATQSAQAQTVDPALEQRIMHSRGRGEALPPAISTSMALQTGYDFSNVRIKTDSEAAELSSSLHARAFTLGSDIWLGKNESTNDVNLMAHELTHVVQQGAAQRISPKSIAGFEHMHSQSKVREYLQALVNGGKHDPSIYTKEIDQFQKDNTSEQIGTLQRQVLEKPQALDIRQHSGSQALRKCAGRSSSSNAPAARATPTNFRQTAGRDAGGGVLHFEYAWDSSSGNLADLSDVEVGEHVAYTQTKNPPFSPAPNPTIIWLPGRDGGLQDNHSPGTVKPYEAFTERATQHYRWRRGTGGPVNLMGPIQIDRTITQNANLSYKYRITKSGLAAEIDPLP